MRELSASTRRIIERAIRCAGTSAAFATTPPSRTGHGYLDTTGKRSVRGVTSYEVVGGRLASAALLRPIRRTLFARRGDGHGQRDRHRCTERLRPAGAPRLPSARTRRERSRHGRGGSLNPPDLRSCDLLQPFSQQCAGKLHLLTRRDHFEAARPVVVQSTGAFVERAAAIPRPAREVADRSTSRGTRRSPRARCSLRPTAAPQRP